ncbi:MAG: S8 family serine peptidase [Bradymonadia bacterium]
MGACLLSLVTLGVAEANPTWGWRAYPNGPRQSDVAQTHSAGDVGAVNEVGVGLSKGWMLVAPAAGLDEARVARHIEEALLKENPQAVLVETSTLLEGRMRVHVEGLDAPGLYRLAMGLVSQGHLTGAWPGLTRGSGVGYVDEALAVKFVDGPPAQGLKAHGVTLVEETALPGVWRARADDQDAIGASWRLTGLPGVAWATPDLIRHVEPYALTDDPQINDQWHLENAANTGDVNAAEAWETTTGSPDVIIAIFDTGTDMDHPDLVENIVGGFDAISGDDDPSAECSNSEDGRGRAPGCPANAPYRESHGTAVSGVSAARGDNGEGGAGVCPLCSLYPVRIIGVGGGQRSLGTGEAFRRAADAGAAIINNSWGPSQTQFFPLAQPEREAFFYVTREARDGLGVALVFAAGNDFFTPAGANPYAAFPEVITVSASSRNDDFACYSNYGDVISVAGPSRGCFDGEDGIWTTDFAGEDGYAGGDYTSSFGGTSAASPVVSGVAGLVLSANPDLTAQQVRWVLESTAAKITADKNPWERLVGQDLAEFFAYDEQGFSRGFGYGRVDAAGAVLLAAQIAESEVPVMAGACTDDCVECIDNRCATACETDADCPGAWRCLEGDETNTLVCRRPPIAPDAIGEACSADCENCLPTFDSNFDLVDVCTATCEDDEGCPFGFDCRLVEDGERLCVPGNAECGTLWGEERCQSSVRVVDGGTSYCSCSCQPGSPGACPEGFMCSSVICEAGRNSILCEATSGQGNYFPSCVPDPNYNPTCEAHTDCPGGLFCVDGECQIDPHPQGCVICAPCQRTQDCGAGYQCVRTARGSRCLSPCEGEEDASCPGDSVCGQIPGTGDFCMNPEWLRKGVCPPAYRCALEGRCFEPEDCPDGVSCSGGFCDYPEVPDAALPEPDAELPDAMVMEEADAEAPDAGSLFPDAGGERARSSGGGCEAVGGQTSLGWMMLMLGLGWVRRRR